MWPDRVSNPGPLNYESGSLLTALHGPSQLVVTGLLYSKQCLQLGMLVLLFPYIPGSNYLPPAKKLISNSILV